MRRNAVATRKAPARKKASKKVAQRKTARTTMRANLKRLEDELPPTLREFARGVRLRLTRLEREIHKADVARRRRWTKLLRDASHQLGRYEAQGERQWKKLTRQARQEAVSVLQRLERAVAPPKPKRKKAARKATRKRAEARGSGI
jgi:hypothetical protein